MGTFGRLVFCEVRTQIVGKTQFFDSLSRRLFFFQKFDFYLFLPCIPHKIMLL